MKIKRTYWLLTIVMIAFSCKNSQGPSISKSQEEDWGEERAARPCEKFPDETYYRSTGQGEGIDEQYSIDLARKSARDQIAQDINIKIMNILGEMKGQAEDPEAFHKKTSDISLQVVNQSLQDVMTHCKRTFKKENKFTSFVGVEIDKKKMKKLISSSNSEVEEFDAELFGKLFDTSFSEN